MLHKCLVIFHIKLLQLKGGGGGFFSPLVPCLAENRSLLFENLPQQTAVPSFGLEFEHAVIQGGGWIVLSGGHSEWSTASYYALSATPASSPTAGQCGRSVPCHAVPADIDKR